MTTLQESVEQLAEEIEETKEIKIIRPNWEDLVTKVVAIDLEIKYWRGETKLRKEDLGLEESDSEYQEFLEENIRLGTKRIMPQRFSQELKLIESRARQLLHNMTQPSGWGHLMNRKYYPAWKEKITDLQIQFYALGGQLANELDQVVEEMQEAYEKAAQGAWKIRKGNGGEEAPEEFVNQFVQAILSRIPSAQEIRESFYLDWIPSYVAPPSELEAERLEAQKLREEYSKLQEQDQEKWQQFREEQTLEKEIREKARKRWYSQVENTLEEASSGIRNLINDTLTNALEALQRNQFLPGRNSTALKNLVTRSRALNFLDDPEIEARLQEIEGLAQVGKDTDFASLEESLTELRNQTKLELLSLERSSRGSRKLEEVSFIEEGGTRKGRESFLETEENPEELLMRN